MMQRTYAREEQVWLVVWYLMNVEVRSFVEEDVFYSMSMKMFHLVIEWLNND